MLQLMKVQEVNLHKLKAKAPAQRWGFFIGGMNYYFERFDEA